MALWLKGFERVDLGPDGGPYDDRTRPKIGWHMTQGSTLEGAEDAFEDYPPHLGVDPKRRKRRQYIDLHRHAYAFAGAESDDEYIIQIEVCGFSEQAHLMPEDELRWLGEEVVRPLREAIGVPDTIVWHGFRGAGEGIVLAHRDSPIRLTPAELRAFSGHLGHQHMPDPDHHWDPGALPIHKILAYSKASTLTEDIDMGGLTYVVMTTTGKRANIPYCISSNGTDLVARGVKFGERAAMKAAGVPITMLPEKEFNALLGEAVAPAEKE